MPKPNLTTAALILALSGPAWTTAAQDAASDEPIDPPPAEPSEDDGGLFADPETGDNPADNDQPETTPRVEAEDLTLGGTVEVEGNQATLRFHADGPGMLTLLAYAPGNRTRVQLQIKDADGRLLPGGMVNGAQDPNNFGARIVVDPFGNPQGSLPGLAYLTLPITEAGDYQIEMGITGEHEDPAKIGGAWVGFEQLLPQAQVQPPGPVVPPPPPPPAVDPTEEAVELAIEDSAQLQIDRNTQTAWVKLTAEDAGTLVLVTNARNADVHLELYADGQFDSPREYIDHDRQGNAGREALMFHADAGEVWYIKVNAFSGRTVPVRTSFIPDDLEAVDDE